jgi:hypothetical protein
MAYSTTSNGLTATAGDGSVYSPRQFTATAWLLWTLIPPLALSALAWVTDYAEQSAGNTNPASVTAGIGAALIMILLLTPIVTTLQWLILRRAWPSLVWLAWLLVVVLSVFASVVAEPIVLMKTASPLYGAALAIFAVGIAVAAVLGRASPQSLRRSAFLVIFLFFLGGGALIYGINTPLIGDLLIHSAYSSNSFTAQPSSLSLMQVHISSFIFDHLAFLSLASGAALSGFGLWLASRWISKHQADLLTVS